jgi:hypothetical protein
VRSAPTNRSAHTNPQPTSLETEPQQTVSQPQPASNPNARIGANRVRSVLAARATTPSLPAWPCHSSQLLRLDRMMETRSCAAVSWGPRRTAEARRPCQSPPTRSADLLPRNRRQSPGRAGCRRRPGRAAIQHGGTAHSSAGPPDRLPHRRGNKAVRTSGASRSRPTPRPRGGGRCWAWRARSSTQSANPGIEN